MKKIWHKWKEIAEIIGNFQAAIVFSILYFILITPFGVVRHYFQDMLNSKKKSSWQKIEDNVSSLEKLKKQ